MKSRMTVMALGLLLNIVAGLHWTQEAEAQENPRVAVIAFENRSQWWAQALGDLAADQLTTRLVNIGGFTVIERQQLAAILEEQGFHLTGQVDPDQLAEIGRIAGVDYLITGSVTRFSIDQTTTSIMGRNVGYTNAQAKLNVRAFNTTTAEIAVAAEGSGSKRMVGVSGILNMSTAFNSSLAEQAIGPAVDDIAEQFFKQKARLVAIERPEPEAPLPQIVGSGGDGSVYIDQGENAGVKVGQRYEVLRIVDEIISPAGELLDVLTEKVGVLEVTRVLSRSSVCRVVEGEAMEGDALKVVEG